MPSAVLMDTSFVIALENPRDPHHDKAHLLDDELSAGGFRYVLHWGILLEIADGFSRVDRRQRGSDLLDLFLRHGGYSVIALSESLLSSGTELYQSRMDKSWGLTDCLSFVIMQEAGITDALTADIHFQQAGFRALLLEP